MPPDLRLDPERLLQHAALASALAEELCAALRGAPVDGGPLPDEQERLLGVVGAAVRELAELSAVLGGAATAATAADAEVSAVLTHVREAFGQELA
jgi:hypothetical protein